MVTLTEVEDEHFQGNQAGPIDDDDYSDTGESTFPHTASYPVASDRRDVAIYETQIPI